MAYRNDDHRRDFGEREDIRNWSNRGSYRDSDDDDREGRRERGYGGWDPRQYGYGYDAREDERSRSRGREDYRGDRPGLRGEREWRDRDWRDEHRGRGDDDGGRYGRGGVGEEYARWGGTGPAGFGLGGFGMGGLGMGGMGTSGVRSGIPNDEFRGGDRYAYRGSRDRSDQDRGLWDRTRDEVASWFGDDDAQRRRMHDDHRGRGPRGYVRSDDRIREDVCERLTDDSFVDASDVEIHVANGEVTLSGTVASRDARRRAEDCAERVSGVQHVQNNLRVKRPGTGAMIDPATGGGVSAGTVPSGGGGPGSGIASREGGRH